MTLYWKPVNTLGYRDIERTESEFLTRRSVLVVGDSFVAGVGIDEARQRFSDVLGDRLGKGWVVANVAQLGSTTTDEIGAIHTYPFRLDRIILSYFINDIEGAAKRKGIVIEHRLYDPGPLIRPLVQHSYLVDYAYWRVYKFRNADEMGRRYYDFLTRCYSDPAVWKEHEAELTELVRYCRDCGIGLTVVIFPLLTNVEKTREYTTKVADLFRVEGVDTLDLTPILAGRDPATLIVSPIDAHPYVALHREVAERLLGHFSEWSAGKP